GHSYRAGGTRNALIEVEIVERHSPRGEAGLEQAADASSIEGLEVLRRRHGLGHTRYDEPRDAVLDDFGHRTTVEGDNRRAAGHRLDHHEAERLGPVDREEQPDGTPEEITLLLLADFANELDDISIFAQHRPDLGLVIGEIGIVYLGRYLEGHAAPRGDFDGQVRSLLR